MILMKINCFNTTSQEISWLHERMEGGNPSALPTFPRMLMDQIVIIRFQNYTSLSSICFLKYTLIFLIINVLKIEVIIESLEALI